MTVKKNPYQRLYGQRNSVYPDPVMTWSVVRYDKNDVKYFNSRALAMLHSRSISAPSQIFFHFYEKQLSRLKFNVEPKDSLQDLLRLRAQELRDTYRYIRLWVSGGSDSMTALNAFVQNNIHIDEIIIHLYDNNKINSIGSFCKEAVSQVAIPYLQKHRHVLKDTRVTFYKSDLTTLSDWHVDPDAVGELVHMHCLDDMQNQLRLPTSGAMSLIDSPNADLWCDIIGGQKTKMCLRNNRWYVYDVDKSMLTSALATTTEDFFISKDMPTLFLKTAYNLKNFFIKKQFSAEQIDHWCNIGNLDTCQAREYNTAIGRISLPDCSYKKHNNKNMKLEDDDKEWITRTQSAEDQVTKIYTRNKKMMATNFSFLSTGFLSRFYCLNDGLSYDNQGIWMSN